MLEVSKNVLRLFLRKVVKVGLEGVSNRKGKVMGLDVDVSATTTKGAYPPYTRTRTCARTHVAIFMPIGFGTILANAIVVPTYFC